jgi:hypothetical protein
MLVSRLHRFFTAPIDKRSASEHFRTSTSVIFWFGLSLSFAFFYGILGLLKAVRNEYVVQDDAREYVFWMQRFIDPELLPHDLIADYFKSITPPGFATVYQLMASLDINPLLLSKILPIVLSLIATAYCFGVCLQIFPVPMAGFIATFLLNQSLWFQDDLVSATPRSFVYPLFLAFLYYMLRTSWLAMCVTLVLQALIYPVLIFISEGILFLRLWDWKCCTPRLKQKQSSLLLCVAAMGLGFLAIVPYALASSEFNPLVTATQARGMPEFWPGGRHPFFDDNSWRFWLIGQHSGIIPPLLPPLIWVGLLLPIVLQKLSCFPLVKQVKSEVTVLSQIVLVSLCLFFAAHALLLKLFFPTRYTGHTLRIVMALAAGIMLTLIVDALFRACEQMTESSLRRKRFWVLVSMVTLGATLVLFPNFSKGFPKTNYRVSNESALYKFFQRQPKNILIATLSDEANNIPTFAQRSILVGKEYALPFHLGYYRQIHQRSIDLIHAQYSQDLLAARQLIQKYGITFWLLDRVAFTPDYLSGKSWLRSFQPAFTEALTSLEQGTVPALVMLTKRCSVFETKSMVVLEADCITHAQKQ